MGAALGQPRTEKAARTVAMEQYVGCGRSFARGDRPVRMSVASNSSRFVKKQHTEIGGVYDEVVAIAQVACEDALPGSRLRRSLHPQDVLVPQVKPHTTDGQHMLRASGGFRPYPLDPVAQQPGIAPTMPQLTVVTIPTILSPPSQTYEQPVRMADTLTQPAQLPPIGRNSRILLENGSRIQHEQINSGSQRAAVLEDKYNRVKWYAENYNMDYAHQELQEFMQQFGQDFQRHPEYLQKKVLFEQVERQYADIIYYSSLYQKSKWVLKDTVRGIKVYLDTSGQNISGMVEMELNLPIEMFIAGLIEINLFKNWIPFVVYSKEERRVTENIIVGHAIFDIPILSKRQSFFQGAGYDRLDTNGTIFVYNRSIDNRPDLLKLFNYTPRPKKGSVIVNFDYMCLEYRPTSAGKGHLRMYSNVDLKLGRTPKFLMEFVVIKFSVELIEGMLKISKKFKGSEWERAMHSNPTMFLFFQRVVRQYLEKRSISA